MSLKEFTDLLAIIVWPIIVAGVVVAFRSPLYSILDRLATSLSVKNIKIKLVGVELDLTPDQAKNTLAELLQDIAETMNELGREDIELFQSILTAEGRLTVEQIIPGFQRESESHKRLGVLRDRKLVRPAEDGRWQAHKRPVVTRFGKLVWKMREAKSDASGA